MHKGYDLIKILDVTTAWKMKEILFELDCSDISVSYELNVDLSQTYLKHFWIVSWLKVSNSVQYLTKTVPSNWLRPFKHGLFSLHS